MSAASESRIVTGFDDSPAGWRALEWASREAALRRCALEVVHVDEWRTPLLEQPVFREEALLEEEILEKGLRWVAQHWPSVEVTGRRLPPPAQDALVGRSIGASLLVVGSRGLGEAGRLLLGSVSRHCVEHARCTVVVVRDA